MSSAIRSVAVMVYLLPFLAAGSTRAADEMRKSEPPRDFLGDPLPVGVVARLGSNRLWHASMSAITFSADGKELGTLGNRPDSKSSFESAICWWDAATGRLLRELRFPHHPLTAWIALPDGKRLALGVADYKGCRVALWDISKGEEIDGPLMEHTWTITFLNLLPDGKTLVSRDDTDGSFYFWDLTTRKQVNRLLPIVPRKKHYTKNDSALSRWQAFGLVYQDLRGEKGGQRTR